MNLTYFIWAVSAVHTWLGDRGFTIYSGSDSVEPNLRGPKLHLSGGERMSMNLGHKFYEDREQI